MGKHARIQELEREIERWKARATVGADVVHFLRILAAMPDDAVLLYTVTGHHVSHEVGKAARVLLQKLPTS